MIDDEEQPLIIRDMSIGEMVGGSKADHVSGAYVIEHEATGAFYVGSSSNLRQRLHAHGSQLRNGKHETDKLQELFDYDDSLIIEVFKTNTHSEALDLEQKMLDEHHGKPNCLNIASNSRITRLGVPQSEEGKRKQRETMTGRKSSSEAIEKQRAYMLAIPEKHIAALIAGGKKYREENLEEFLAKQERMRIGNMGRKPSEETREKLRLAQAKLRDSGASSENKKLAASNRTTPNLGKAGIIPVSINNTIHPSVNSACKALNMCAKSVNIRLNSDEEQFKDWFKL